MEEKFFHEDNPIKVSIGFFSSCLNNLGDDP